MNNNKNENNTEKKGEKVNLIKSSFIKDKLEEKNLRNLNNKIDNEGERNNNKRIFESFNNNEEKGNMNVLIKDKNEKQKNKKKIDANLEIKKEDNTDNQFLKKKLKRGKIFLYF